MTICPAVTGVDSNIKNLAQKGTKEFMMRESGAERGKAEERRQERTTGKLTFSKGFLYVRL